MLLDNCFKSDQILSKLEKQYPTSASLWITDGSINNSTEQMDLSLVSFWTNHCFSFSRNSMDHDCLPIYLKGERLLSKNLIESILKIERKPFFFSFSYYLQCKCSEALNLTLEFLKGKSITLLQIQWNFFFKIWSLLLDVERERKKNFWNGLLKYERMVKEKEVWTCWSSFKSYFEFWVFSFLLKNLCFLNCRNFEKTITLFSKFDEL